MPNGHWMHGMPVTSAEQVGEVLQRQGRVSTRAIIDLESGRSKAVLLEVTLGKGDVFRLLRIEGPKAKPADFAGRVADLWRWMLAQMSAPNANPFPVSWPDYGKDDKQVAYERGITACEIYDADVVKTGGG